MTRLNLVLLAAVLVSALYLVQTQYESRNLTVQLHRADQLARRLDVEFDRLQVERRAQATPARVEKLATDQLKMRPATPAITQYISTSTGEVIPMPLPEPPATTPATQPRRARP